MKQSLCSCQRETTLGWTRKNSTSLDAVQGPRFLAGARAQTSMRWSLEAETKQGDTRTVVTRTERSSGSMQKNTRNRWNVNRRRWITLLARERSSRKGVRARIRVEVTQMAPDLEAGRCSEQLAGTPKRTTWRVGSARQQRAACQKRQPRHIGRVVFFVKNDEAPAHEVWISFQTQDMEQQ